MKVGWHHRLRLIKVAYDEYMKERLVEIGLHMQNIRELFSWNQDEFALRLGVSRPTISNAERQPDKLSKTVALAMFLVVTAELEHRKQVVHNFKESNVKREVEKVVAEQLKKWGTSVPNSITSGLGSRTSAFLSPAGLSIAGKIAGKIAGTLADSVLSIKQMTDKDDIDTNREKIIKYQTDLLVMIEEKLLLYFGTLDAVQFIQSLESPPSRV